MRWVSTRVLPLPAPAKINKGPSSAVTAARCGGFSPARRSTPRSAAEEVTLKSLQVYRLVVDESVTPSAEPIEIGSTLLDPRANAHSDKSARALVPNGRTGASSHR